MTNAVDGRSASIRVAARLLCLALLLIVLTVYSSLPVFSGTETSDAYQASVFAEPGDEGEEEPVIPVTGLELGDYKDRMTVGETQELAVNVLPPDATNQTLLYSSGNESAVTVSSKGQVKAVGEGVAVIRVKAGEITKEIGIEVRVATAMIEVNSGFLILSPGESFALKASAVPYNAPQSLSFKSTNTSVAEVSESGRVRAIEVGSSSIIISNGDASVAVIVLVNKKTVAGTASADGGTNAVPIGVSDDIADVTAGERRLIESIKASAGVVQIRQSDHTVITKALLKTLYRTRTSLVVEGDGYTITLAGEDIENDQNELFTEIQFRADSGNVDFILNRNEKLPGKIEVALTDRSLARDYLYLFNSGKGKYQRLEGNTDDGFTLDEAGKYRLTDERIGRLAINPLWAGIALGVVLVGVALFIVFRRRYWFW
jgi:hypothetical protein